VNARVDNPPRLRLAPPARGALLTLHIVVSVGLLGDSAGPAAMTRVSPWLGA
jgi:hypothetical protein